MNPWDRFPTHYRAAECEAILKATRRGACVALLGLSGSGKSNLLGFLAHRHSSDEYRLLLVDCNRLLQHDAWALLNLINKALGASHPLPEPATPAFEAVNEALAAHFQACDTLTLLFDRFDIFAGAEQLPLHNVLRALRDGHKYRLGYVFATRRPLPLESELAELVQGHALWLGPLSEADARWNVQRFARRHGENWDDDVARALLDISGGYPSLLKAACEAYAGGTPLDEIAQHPAVQARIEEFWRDEPPPEFVEASGLAEHPLLTRRRGPSVAEESLTARESLLYDYLRAHANEVCSKDNLIRAVWPEDVVYEEGVRDSSLAQLVRRLRLKVEQDASNPRFIQTVPGRGYLFRTE